MPLNTIVNTGKSNSKCKNLRRIRKLFDDKIGEVFDYLKLNTNTVL
jgi:hypothetical protein